MAEAVDSYLVQVFSSRATTNLDPTAPPVAEILLLGTGPDGKPRTVGTARFFPDGTPLPPGATDGGGSSTVNFNLSQLSAVLDVLREEKPVSVNANAIFTGPEPTGEEENVGG